LSDVLFGTRNVAGLSIGDIEGATDWSDALLWTAGMRAWSGQSSIPMHVIYRMSRVASDLYQATTRVAGENAGGDLDAYQWSRDQRALLHDNSFPGVRTYREERSFFQAFAEQFVGCVISVDCTGAWLWGTTWEQEWGG